MPQFYKRKTDRATKTPADVMQRATNQVEQGHKMRSVAKDFNIDKMTLYRFVKKRKTNPDAIPGYGPVRDAHLVLTPAMEQDMGIHVKLLADQFHGLTLEKCCKLACEFAVRNERNVSEAWTKNGKARKGWWLGFKKRLHLSIQSPEGTSAGRASTIRSPEGSSAGRARLQI